MEINSTENGELLHDDGILDKHFQWGSRGRSFKNTIPCCPCVNRICSVKTLEITSNELQTKLGHAHQKSSNCANDFGDKQQAAKYLFKKSGVCGEHNTVIVE